MAMAANFMIAGEAGQGVQSAGFILSKALARGGYSVFADQDYESRIRGGHNFFRIRVSDSEVGAVTEPIDILLALNQESIELHRNELAEGGVIVFDEERVKNARGNGYLLPIPMDRLAEEKAGNRIMGNTVALGACLGLLGYDLKLLEDILQGYFGEGKVSEANVRAARIGYEYGPENFKKDFAVKLRPVSRKRRLLLNGHEALALGALAAGCNFMTGYPMTPASPILEYMASKARDMGLVVVQPEDEIAAINMVIGASYAGARAMTATSGSGFCLMVEGLGLAGLTETPIVVVDAQRPGPAVGLPTRTEQGDLQFVLSAHHGDVPRAVLAPATVEEAFWLTVEAFNLAERYQLPVIILTDHYLATSYAMVDGFDLSRVAIDRGEIFAGRPEKYKRHAVTESGISPRAFPGLSEALVVTDSDEHDELGHLTESAQTRTEQVAKRLRKISALKGDITPPELYGPKKAELTLIGWGSTYGALREVVDILSKEVRLNLLHFRSLWPFPAESVDKILAGSEKVCIVENNATGQLARLIRAETGREISRKILKYDGRPFTPAYIVERLRKEEI
jgi:2-oxoglutarate ferredoxin oxidoreductase subunit alpha